MVIKILLLLFVLLLIIFLVWRIASSYYAIPCPSWLGWMVELENPLASVTRARTIIEQLQLSPTMNVLDAGCGPGRITIPLAHALPKGTVTALDIQKEMLEKVRKKATGEHLPNIVYHQAALGDNTLTPNTFDRIVIAAVLGEIPHQEAALTELYTALKPGGMLLISETRFDPHFQSYSSLLKRTQTIGFVEKKHNKSLFAYTLLLQKPAQKNPNARDVTFG